MDDKLVATGMSYELKECAVFTFVIPPLELPNGEQLRLRNADVVMSPLRFLLHSSNGPVQASFDPLKARWEIING